MNNKNLLKLLTNLRRPVKVPMVMFPVSKVWEACSSFYPKLLRFSLDRTSRLAGRARIGLNFSSFILKMSKHHGSSFTVKWLKACSVCLQKYLGGARLNSLRELEPNLPLPRLINGLPAIINKQDRHFIRQGNTSVIRFWLTLFSIYRIISIPGKLKLETITDLFKGDIDYLNSLITTIEEEGFQPFDKLRIKFQEINLAPRKLLFSYASSPSSKVSYKGLLTDMTLLMGQDVQGNISRDGQTILNNLLDYLGIMRHKWNTKPFQSTIEDAMYLATVAASNNLISLKKGAIKDNGLSQFALKYEAAGKIRVFALVDSWTQSILSPLHKALFSIIQSIPNDGTFDQESSARRAVDKSLKYGLAYSFDLSAATDRLPVDLTASILEHLSGISGFGEKWKNVLVDRSYTFSTADSRKLKLTEDQWYLKYSVGQPMGALSSWAGLAITHHFIVQLCARNLGYKSWYDRYEILGDDLVIFDTPLSEEYLKIMKLLGLEINLSKSIISPKTPAFEYAKRTYFKGVNVSAVPWKMFFTANSLSGRISLGWTALNAYRFKTVSVLGSLLQRWGPNLDFSKLGFESLGTLSQLSNKGLVEHKEVVDSVVNPSYGVEFDMELVEKLTIPSKSILDLAVQVMSGDRTHLPSHEVRREWTEELEPFMADEYLKLALFKLKTYNSNLESMLNEWGVHLLNPKSPDFKTVDKLYKAQLNGFFQSHFLSEAPSEDISEWVDRYEAILYKHAKYRQVTLSESIKLLSEAETYILKYTVADSKVKKTNKMLVSEHSNVAANIIKGIVSTKTNYWDF